MLGDLWNVIYIVIILQAELSDLIWTYLQSFNIIKCISAPVLLFLQLCFSNFLFAWIGAHKPKVLFFREW